MKSIYKKLLSVSLFSLFMSISPSFVYAQLCGGNGIDTAIGCIPVDSTTGFTTFILKWGIGIGGGISLILIAYAGVLLMTAGGDLQKVQAGKELMTAAIAGLAFLIFSAFILRLIGVNILGIPELAA